MLIFDQGAFDPVGMHSNRCCRARDRPGMTGPTQVRANERLNGAGAAKEPSLLARPGIPRGILRRLSGRDAAGWVVFLSLGAGSLLRFLGFALSEFVPVGGVVHDAARRAGSRAARSAGQPSFLTESAVSSQARAELTSASYITYASADGFPPIQTPGKEGAFSGRKWGTGRRNLR